MTDFSSRAEAIRRLTEVELDAILLREVCHSRQNWQRDGDWHDWIEISPDERERLVAAAKSVARLTAQVETLQGERDFGRAGSIQSYFDRMKEIAKRYDDLAEAVWPENEREVFGYGDCIVRAVKAREAMKLLGTATTLAATHFDRANAAEAQVETLTAENERLKRLRALLRACLYEAKFGTYKVAIDLRQQIRAALENSNG